jgi:hypothetical protein
VAHQFFFELPTIQQQITQEVQGKQTQPDMFFFGVAPRVEPPAELVPSQPSPAATPKTTNKHRTRKKRKSILGGATIIYPNLQSQNQTKLPRHGHQGSSGTPLRYIQPSLQLGHTTNKDEIWGGMGEL